MAVRENSIAVIGGTGNLGWALACRWVRSGYHVCIGSRGADKAAEAAERIGSSVDAAVVRGLRNEDAAAGCEIIVITVPFAAQEVTLRTIADATAGKLVVDTTVPLVPPKVARVQMPTSGCAALSARKVLGEDARLVSAFHNVAAHKLNNDGGADCDVLVFGDVPADREIAIELAAKAGLHGIHAGPLANSVAAEALTSVLIGINKRYKVDGAGIRITGL